MPYTPTYDMKTSPMALPRVPHWVARNPELKTPFAYEAGIVLERRDMHAPSRTLVLMKIQILKKIYCVVE